MSTAPARGGASPLVSLTTWVTVMRRSGSALIQENTPSTTTG